MTLAPALVRTHPGFARVVGGFLIVDVGFGVSSVLAGPERFAAPAYAPVMALLSFRAWGFVWLALAAVTVAGLYGGFSWLRWACIAGAACHATWGAAFAFAAATDPRVAWYGAVVFLFLVVVHLAAVVEPEHVTPGAERVV